MLFVVTVAVTTFIKHVLLCQLRFFGFLQQLLILTNLNKLGFIKKILEAPTMLDSSDLALEIHKKDGNSGERK